MQNKVEKIQANKLAPDIIGGIIESIEENSTKINGKEDIARVASISANDEKI